MQIDSNFMRSMRSVATHCRKSQGLKPSRSVYLQRLEGGHGDMKAAANNYSNYTESRSKAVLEELFCRPGLSYLCLLAGGLQSTWSSAQSPVTWSGLCTGLTVHTHSVMARPNQTEPDITRELVMLSQALRRSLKEVWGD